MKDWLAVLRAALSLLGLRRPRLPAAPAGAAPFWLALLLVAAIAALGDYFDSEAPRAFDPDGLRGIAFHAVLGLALGFAFARFALHRPALGFNLAALLLLLSTFTEYVLRPVGPELLVPLGIDAERAATALVWAWGAWIALALLQAARWLAPSRALPLLALAAAVCSAALVLPRMPIEIGSLIVSAPVEEDEEQLADDEPAPPAFDTERVMAAQPKLLAERLAQLFPQRPGQVDLYLLGFGGDGDENVFRNEVEYAGHLFAQRFDAGGRTLLLINNEATVAEYPLATRSNLIDSLAGIAKVIDPDEDVVLLFLTSHGSEDHQLDVRLGPLALYALAPEDLRAALDEAGIRHRVVVVSACYSGGFIPALRDDHTMIITAASADRSSFGCGSLADITWFGRAFLVDALNHTDDFAAAFEHARNEIVQWEHEQKIDASDPQIASAPEIERQLARWRTSMRSGLPVPFRPAPKPGAVELVQ